MCVSTSRPSTLSRCAGEENSPQSKLCPATNGYTATPNLLSTRASGSPSRVGTGATTNVRPQARRSRAAASAARSRPNPAASGSLADSRLFSSSSTVTNQRRPAASATSQWWLPQPTARYCIEVTVMPHERPSADARAASGRPSGGVSIWPR